MTAAAWRRILGLLGEGVSWTRNGRLNDDDDDDSRLADMMDDGGRYRGQGRRPNFCLSHMKQLPNGRLQRIEWYENEQLGKDILHPPLTQPRVASCHSVRPTFSRLGPVGQTLALRIDTR
jgi:hypothetical protein